MSFHPELRINGDTGGANWTAASSTASDKQKLRQIRINKED